MDSVNISNIELDNDIHWWTGNIQGKFAVKSAWEILRNKK